MISIVLYGRNDSYGYNLHKRAALSLNCMAEVLSHEDDEILFVDYNTPDDYPTFPEAICDTLTEKAKRLLRVIRIRPDVHNRLFASKTHLKALEPISRNVAVRRSNPANRWILSTNTDMIFVPRGERSLSDVVARLPDGFYCTPRFEIPETLWEGFDRYDPAGVIDETRRAGEDFHLNEVVFGRDEFRYDAPGDFQLVPRDILFAINGFDERMLLGWHVDANISKRLKIHFGEVGDGLDVVLGYHCDHTRQVTPAHAHKSAENSQQTFIEDVSSSALPEQAKFWGLADLELEECSLATDTKKLYADALKSVIGSPLTGMLCSKYRPETYDSEVSTPEHVLPFLVDLFANASKSTKVCWIGRRDRIFDLFNECWQTLGYSHEITNCSTYSLDDANTFIVNFGTPRHVIDDEASAVLQDFNLMVGNEIQRLADGCEPRRIIGVNAIHNRFEPLMHTFVNCSRTPFSARLRHGYLIQSAFAGVQNWTAQMMAGSAGEVVNRHIQSNGSAGHVFYGPYVCLMPGQYRVSIQLDKTWNPGAWKPLKLEILQGKVLLSARKISLFSREHTYNFDMKIKDKSWFNPIEVRLYSRGGISIKLNKVVVEKIS